MTLSLDRQNAYRNQYRQMRPGWQPATEAYEAAIRARLKPGMRVLDVGCGRGGVLEQLGADVAYPVGIDPDLESLREHRMPILPRAESNAAAIPFRGACADLVLCSWVVEHLPDPMRVFEEVRRVLRPDGYFIFLTPNATSLPALLNRALHPLQHTLVPRLYGRAEADTFPLAYRANTPHRITSIARQAGFRVEQLLEIPDPTYFAFTPVLFRLSAMLARITPSVHLIGVMHVAHSTS
jgi:ubiquinone/menaquinone biosynthesis C-methylase UbiE